MTLIASQTALVESFRWDVLMPELLLLSFGLLLLTLEISIPKRTQFLPKLALGAQGILLVLMVWEYFSSPSEVHSGVFFGGSIVQTAGSAWMRIFFLLCSLFVSNLAWAVLKDREVARVEYFFVQLVVTASLMLLVQSGDFLMLFLSLEMVTIGFYILVAYLRDSQFSLEAGLKYLIMGAFSSGLMLFGIALLYGVAGNPLLEGSVANPLNLNALAGFIASSTAGGVRAPARDGRRRPQRDRLSLLLRVRRRRGRRGARDRARG